MSILEKLKSNSTGVRRKVYEAARTEAEGKSPSTNNTADLIHRAGMSESDFAEAVNFYEHVINLEQIAANREKDAEAKIAAREALEAHEQETTRIKEERQAQYAALMADNQAKEASSKRSKSAERELGALRYQYPERFGVKAIDDLDAFTLRWQNNVLSAGDPTAETLEVDKQTFEKQAARRGRIMSAARDKVNAEKRFGVTPDWPTIVRMGWHRSLDTDHAA